MKTSEMSRSHFMRQGASSATTLDYNALASDLVRALRGRRSQSGLSRMAGYRSNVVHRWERGLCWPGAAAFLALCERIGIDVGGAVRGFHGHSPTWLARHPPTSVAGVAAFIEDLRGKTPLIEVARRTGYDRRTVGRWLRGGSEPRLPELLHLVDVLSRRALDLVSQLVDPARLPSAARAWQRLCAAREAAYRSPWSHAVLRALELHDHRARGAGDVRWLAQKLGVTDTEVENSLQLLRKGGQVRRRGSRWSATRLAKVDTRQDPQRALSLRAAWTREAVRRMEQGSPGSFGFSLFAISSEGMQELRDLHLQYVRAMQSIIARSAHNDCVGLYCAQLLDLDPGEGNALSTVEMGSGRS